MIHPSYVELMKVVNDNVEIGEEPVVNSRYSIVCVRAQSLWFPIPLQRNPCPSRWMNSIRAS